MSDQYKIRKIDKAYFVTLCFGQLVNWRDRRFAVVVTNDGNKCTRCKRAPARGSTTKTRWRDCSKKSLYTGWCPSRVY
jgi:hypothetical protein